MASQIANNWKELSAYGVHDFSSDSFKIILMEPGFTFDRANHEVYADVSGFELPTAGGYTAGGQALAGVAIVNDAVLAATIISWNNVLWTATADLQKCGAIIFDDTIAAPDIDPIVGFIDYGGTLTTYNGGTHTVANIAVAYT